MADRRRTRTLELLHAFVAEQTVSESSNEALLRAMAEVLDGCGADIRLLPGEAGRFSLLARFGPDRPGGLAFGGHSDVVPAGDGWTTDPWAMTLRADGRAVAGRGVADMKGFLACLLAAAEDIPIGELVEPVHVAVTFDEEIGCRGVRHLLPVMADDANLRPRVLVIGEPTMMAPAVSSLGKVAYEVDVVAAAGHSSEAATRPSAVHVAARLIAALDDLVLAMPSGRFGGPGFIPNVGSVSGGTQTNVIADRCRFRFELRVDGDHDPDEVLAPFTALLTDCERRLAPVGGSIAMREITRYPALSTSPEEPIVQLVQRICDRPTTHLSFGTEGGLFADALGLPVVVCGPGDIADAHRADEHVTLDQLDRCAIVIDELIAACCLRR